MRRISKTYVKKRMNFIREDKSYAKYSDASITLNVYTHASYDHAAEQMTKLVDFPRSSDRQERKMSG